MKKLIMAIAILSLFTSCEIPTITEYITITADQVEPAESLLIGRWSRNTGVMEFLSDGSFNYYDSDVLTDYGVYVDYQEEWPDESVVSITLDAGMVLIYEYVLIDGYPEPDDLSMNMVLSGSVSALNWVKE